VDVRDRAVGYMRASPGGAWVPNTGTLPWRGTAAGGGYSTVGDLLRFAQALRSGTLISEATLAEATRPHHQQYGYGFDVQGQGRLRSYGHGGGAPGMNGELRVFPQLGYVVVGLAPGTGRRAALVAGASFSHHAQGGGIWPDGAGMPDPSRKRSTNQAAS
jgi:D-alanyl-D-alanine carboxypeptidase